MRGIASSATKNAAGRLGSAADVGGSPRRPQVIHYLRWKPAIMSFRSPVRESPPGFEAPQETRNFLLPPNG